MAFGQANDVEITIKADAAGALAAFDNVGNKLGELALKSDKAGEGITRSQGKILAFNSTLELVHKTLDGMNRGFEFLERGAQVDDIASSFDNLSRRAGVTSDVLLNKFSAALGDTISKTEVMEKANELLLGHLDPSKYELVAQAARKFAEVNGGSVKQALDGVTNSLLRGDDRFFKRIGVIIDNNRALDEYAKKMNIVGRTLSEAEQVEAHRDANLKALNEQQSKLSKVVEDAGDKVAKLKAAYKDEFDQVARNIANDETLLKLLNDLVKVMGEVPKLLSETIKGLQGQDSEVNRGIGFLKDYTVGLVTGKGAIVAYRDAMLDSAKAYGEQLKASEKSAGQLKFEAITKQIAARLEGERQKAAKDAADKEAAAERVRLKADEDARIAREKAITATTKYAEANKQLDEQIRKLTSSGGLTELQFKIKDIFADGAEGVIGPKKMQEALRELQSEYPRTSEGVQQLADDIQVGFKAAEEAIQHATDAQKDYQKQQDELKAAAQQDGEEFGSIFAQAVTSAVSGNLSQALGDVMSGIASKVGGEAGKVLGEQMGGAFGAGFGGPVGAAIGSVIGARLNSDIQKALKGNGKDLFGDALALPTGGLSYLIADKLFGGDSEGTAARKKADKYFADLFDANRISVVIGGQLTQLHDLVFSGNQDLTSGVYSGLSDGARAAFDAIGMSMEKLIGISSDLGVNLNSVLAGNLGGDLNNLQLVVEATGQSFEDLGNTIIQSMLMGDISVQAAAAELQQLQNIMQKGIPGAVGAVDRAWKNLQSAGEKGGRALLDSISDVAAEARELGASTLPQLQDMLVNTFHVPRGEAQKFFDALSIAGVNSFDDLLHASNATLIAIAANYENLIKGLNAGFQSAQPPADGDSVTDTPNFTTPRIPSGGGAARGGGSSGKSAADKAKEDADKRAAALKSQNDAIDNAVQASKDYDAILKQVAAHELDSAAASAQLLGLRTKATELIKAQTAAHKALEAAEAKAAKGNKSAAASLQDLFFNASQADQALSDFQKGAAGLKDDIVNSNLLLPNNFNVTVTGDGQGLKVTDIQSLVAGLNSLPLTKTFTLRLQVAGSDRDKNIISKLSAAAFTGPVGQGQPTR
jgi:hypothetical protein